MFVRVTNTKDKIECKKSVAFYLKRMKAQEVKMKRDKEYLGASEKR